MSEDIKNISEESEDTYEPVIVSVVDEDGVEHTFEELDTLELDDKEYVALTPIYDDDISDESGELIILERKYEDDDIYLEPIEDENKFMEIGKMFEDRLSDMFEFEED